MCFTPASTLIQANFFVAGNLDHEECAVKKLDTREVSRIIFGAIEVGSVGQNFEFFWFFFRNFYFLVALKP